MGMHALPAAPAASRSSMPHARMALPTLRPWGISGIQRMLQLLLTGQPCLQSLALRPLCQACRMTRLLLWSQLAPRRRLLCCVTAEAACSATGSSCHSSSQLSAIHPGASSASHTLAAWCMSAYATLVLLHAPCFARIRVQRQHRMRGT